MTQSWPELRDAVGKLCADFPNTYWNSLERDGEYPSDFISALTEAGYLAALIPEDYGGSGLPLSAACAILETIHASGCNAAACHAQMYTMGTLLRHGSEDQKSRYLPEIANGRLRLQAFGVSEPTSGSDTTSLKTTAQSEGNGYVLRGQKIWTSRAAFSDLMLVLARTTPLEKVRKPSEGLSVFLVDLREAKENGLSIRPIETMINHNTTEVFFDDVPVPESALIGDAGKGFSYILSGMNAERILIAAECLGDARFFIDRAVDYANGREVFNRPIGKNQGVQFPIARAYADTQAASLMVEKACDLYERLEPCGAEANMAKLLASEASWAAGEAAMDVFGGFAFAREYGIERKWRETRLYRTAPISTNMVLNFIANHVLGLPKSY